MERFERLFRALRYRNYRLFFTGQLLSLIGSWIATVASSWLVFRLTDSAFLLGVTSFASQIPAFLLAPVAGAQADRFDRRRLLMITQALSMLQSFAMAAMTLSGAITVEWVIALSAFQGIVIAFDMPARQAFVSEMVEDTADLPNAIALNSAMFNGARLIGPAVGGLLIAATNEAYCFLLDGISYVAIIFCLYHMHSTFCPQAPRHRSLFSQIGEGMSYAFQFKPIRELLILIACMSLLGTCYHVLLPVIARETFHGGPKTLGLLMSSAGLGALVGALVLAARKSVLGLGKVIALSGAAMGCALVLIALTHILWIACVLLFIAGFSFITTAASINTVIQTLVEDDKRGRVMSIYSMAFVGTMPFGSLLSGSAAETLGVSAVIAFSGLFCLAAACRFGRNLPAIRAAARPIYEAKGLYTPVPHATGSSN